MKPQVELHFATFERAQRAAALVEGLELDNSKVSISEMLFEDRGRMLILKFNSSDALPSDLLSFVFAVINVASIANPVWQRVTIPLVQNSIASSH